jgi:hypothetical protein
MFCFLERFRCPGPPCPISLCACPKNQSPAYGGALDGPIIEGEGLGGWWGASNQPTRLSGFRSGVLAPFHNPWFLLNFQVVPFETDS